MAKHELRVTSQLQVENLKAQVEIQVESTSGKYKLKSTSFEFKFTSYEFKFTSCDFKSMSLKVIK